MIYYHKGDVLKSSHGVIAHGCNCVGGFGAGIARTIADRFPIVRNSYLLKFKNQGWKPGDVQIVPIGPDQVIANCGTQRNYLPRGRDLFEYEAFREVLRSLQFYCLAEGKTLAMPKIGAGLAGGNWERISKIIEEELFSIDVHVYEL